MDDELKRGNTISILSISILLFMGGSLIAPALNSLAQAFPDTPFSTIRNSLTIISLSMAVFAIISGKLASRMPRKNIVLIGLVIFGLTAVVCGQSTSIIAFMIGRLAMGAGLGLAAPQANALIYEFYQGEKRDKLLGYGGALANAGSLIGAAGGGFLVVISWRYNCYAYTVLTLVIFLFVLFGVPGGKEGKAAVWTAAPTKEKLPGKFWILPVQVFFIQTAVMLPPTNMARFYMSEHLGPPAIVGIVMAINTISGFLIGLNLHFIRKIFKDYTFSLSWILVAVGFFMLSVTHSLFVTIAGMFIFGLGNGMQLPSVFIANAKIIPPQLRQQSIAIISSAVYLSGFISSYAQMLVSWVINTPSIRGLFTSFAVIAVVIAIVSCVGSLAGKKNVKPAQ
ncbi:MAG: MFS transporter [Treponema sp.]|jgi:MFS family permease|nr:MFS transporter [Treponema sp.]